MSNLSPLGHYYGLTAAINYLTTIFSDFSVFMYSLLEEFGVDKLSKERVYYEQAHSVYVATLDRSIESAKGKKLADLENLKIEGEIHILKTKKAEIRARAFLDEIRNSSVYKNHFKKRYKPLFPLAGTYSVIFLLFSAFSESYPSSDIICFNTIIFVSISVLILTIGNFRDWFFLKHVRLSTRILMLNLFLVALTFISWALAILVSKNDSLQWVFLSPETEINLIIVTLFFSIIGFFGLAFKLIRVNFVAWARHKAFAKSNNLLRRYLDNLKPR